MFPLHPFFASLRRPLPPTSSSSAIEPNPPSPRRALPLLPPELWLLIIRQAALNLPLYHTSTVPSLLAWLASLSVLSMDFLGLARPELFSAVVVQSLEQLEQLSEVLQTSPSLGKAVRRLHVRWRERESAKLVGSAPKGDGGRSADRWGDGVGRVARLVDLREVLLEYTGTGQAGVSLDWIAGSRKTLVKLTLDSLHLGGTPDALFPFHCLTFLDLTNCNLSPSFGAALPSLFPSLRSLTLSASTSPSHTICTLLTALAPQLESLRWSPKPSTGETRRVEDAEFLATIPLCTSLITLHTTLPTLHHLGQDQLPPSLKRLRLDLRRSGEEAKEVLRVVEMLPLTVDMVDLTLPGWMSVQAGEEMLQQVRRMVAGRVGLRLVKL